MCFSVIGQRIYVSQEAVCTPKYAQPVDNMILYFLMLNGIDLTPIYTYFKNIFHAKGVIFVSKIKLSS
jgi:hypothetical protein